MKTLPPPLALLKAALETRENAYAPYSNFKVGSAVETLDGKIYVGANMENTSYGVTMCAEVGAIQAASSAGRLKDVVRIAVVGGSVRTSSEREGAVITPCGRCRQLLSEITLLTGRDVEVWCADAKLLTIRSFTSSQLLPCAFDVSGLAEDSIVTVPVEYGRLRETKE